MATLSLTSEKSGLRVGWVSFQNRMTAPVGRTWIGDQAILAEPEGLGDDLGGTAELGGSGVAREWGQALRGQIAVVKKACRASGLRALDSKMARDVAGGLVGEPEGALEPEG